MYRAVLGCLSAGSLAGMVHAVHSPSASPELVLVLSASFVLVTAVALFTGPLKSL